MKNLIRFNLILVGLFAGWGQLCAATKNTEIRVEAAAFHLKTNISQKINHDTIVLKSGETVEIEAGSLRTPLEFQRGTFFDYKRQLKNVLPRTFEVRIDEKNGILCFESKCTRAASICPPYEELARGIKCKNLNTQGVK